jgi:hypothetical protein
MVVDLLILFGLSAPAIDCSAEPLKTDLIVILDLPMVDFIDAKTQKVLHRNVSQPDDHLFHIGNKIVITDIDKKSVTEYLITDIKIPYNFSRGFLGGLHQLGVNHSKIYLEHISTESPR